MPTYTNTPHTLDSLVIHEGVMGLSSGRMKNMHILLRVSLMTITMVVFGVVLAVSLSFLTGNNDAMAQTFETLPNLYSV